MRLGGPLAHHEDDEFGLFLYEKPKHSRSYVRKSSRIAAELALLSAERARTFQIVAPLGEADLERQHSPLMSPIAWDLGHIAQFEEQWLVPAAPGRSSPERDRRAV